MDDDRGTYVEHDGRPAVRFVRTYPHPIERVWAVLTEPGELAHWFPMRAEIELRVGGTASSDGMTGTVLAVDPPRRLAYSWGDDELHFTLVGSETGTTTLTMVNVLGARDTAARSAAGWEVCLAEMGKRLAGLATTGPHGDGALLWHPVYDAYIADGMPSGAWIPD